jgi:hypothetical protein
LAITLFCFRFHSFSSTFWYLTITTLSCASFVAVLCFLFVFKVVDLAISSGYTSKSRPGNKLSLEEWIQWCAIFV